LHIECGVLSDRGRVRLSNEDSYIADPKNHVFLVADGMGGHAAGEVASRIAAETVDESISKQRASEGPAEEILRIASEEANAQVYNAQARTPEYGGMGSTLTILLLKGNNYYVAHVGDSRAYLLRSGTLHQLTQDHSVVWRLYEDGILAKAELRSHPQKNLITRSVGPHPYVEVDIEQGEACEGDVYLLCSDGLTDVVLDESICGILSEAGKTPQAMSEDLVNMANAAGGPDNITVVIVRLTAG
jgi:PPM family protein phosphatase